MSNNERDLTHVRADGTVRMVDVGGKDVTAREAVAVGRVRMQAETLALALEARAKKGDVLATARIAGIQAAKKTAELIPLCHAIALSGCDVDITADEAGPALVVRATVRASDRTGVEMEALTAVSIAALTIYDMLKAVDRGIVIEGIHLAEKRGGASGDYSSGDRETEDVSDGRSV